MSEIMKVIRNYEEEKKQLKDEISWLKTSLNFMRGKVKKLKDKIVGLEEEKGYSDYLSYRLHEIEDIIESDMCNDCKVMSIASIFDEMNGEGE